MIITNCVDYFSVFSVSFSFHFFVLFYFNFVCRSVQFVFENIFSFIYCFTIPVSVHFKRYCSVVTNETCAHSFVTPICICFINISSFFFQYFCIVYIFLSIWFLVIVLLFCFSSLLLQLFDQQFVFVCEKFSVFLYN